MSEKERSITLTETETKELIQATVHDTLISLGVEHQNPLEMQKDFQHLREWRQSTDAVKRKGILSLVGILVAAVSGVIVIGFKTYFK